MLSFLLTLFISLFSVSSSINSIDVLKENVNSVNEVSIVNDTSPSKYISYYDVGDVHRLYFTNQDFENGDFWRDFVLNLPSGLQLGFTTINANSYNFNNIAGEFHVVNDYHEGGGMYGCNRMRVSKSQRTEYSYNNVSYTIQTYDFVFIWASGVTETNLLDVVVVFFVPLISTEAYDLGIQCYSVTLNRFSGISSSNFIYREDLSLGEAPLYLYGYIPYSSDAENATNYYQEGFNVGYSNGYNTGYDDGNNRGYQVGYSAGLDAYSGYDSVASSIFTGIFDVGLLPVNVFLTIFNFEIFGVNISGIVSGLLTLSVVIIIIRLLLGGKKDD